MKRIDRETVQRILDAADIVEVVSDFVSLKKRGANWIGLCPFHNERTPSFSVSRSKGICKCFSCGKGGSPLNFIMEHEQLGYQEALRYLARKYHIEIKEHELTDEEREQATERESLLAVNDFALQHFRHNLTDTPDGRDIGMAYFKERGINEAMMQRFSLGYAIDRSDDLLAAARAKGFDEKYLVDTGLCAQNDRGTVYDRYRGRVVYPWFSISGRVVAFGARTLRSDKNVAKYVNSKESAIYHKSSELYGLYQAKGAIVRSDKCILVEGYMDVISMHQVGVENVVASSGTSLTDGQIRMIHRFTENVTVIYDSDAAGIKASLRGIDLLLAQGMNIKVLLLPDGEDPDSFAQKHTGEEVLRYIAEHETDFIRFKTDILLKDAAGDPVARARVINDIVKSISVIPDDVVRAEYIKECSRLLDISDGVLLLQMQKMMAERLEQRQKTQAADRAAAARASATEGTGTPDTEKTSENVPAYTPDVAVAPLPPRNTFYVHEQTLAKYIVKYGLLELPAETAPDGTAYEDEPVSVLDFIWSEMEADSLSFSDPVFEQIFRAAIALSRESWPADLARHEAVLDDECAAAMEQGRQVIAAEATDLADIEAREKMLADSVAQSRREKATQFAEQYIETALLSSDCDDVRRTATELACEKYRLSKVHTRFSKVETERDRLGELVPRAVLELKLAIVDHRILACRNAVKTCDPRDAAALSVQLQELTNLCQLRREFAKILGERIITPS